MAAAPTLIALTLAVPLAAPAGITTTGAASPAINGPLLPSCTVRPSAGAGVESVTVNWAVPFRGTVAGPLSVMVPGAATVTFAVASGTPVALTSITAVPGATGVT